MSPVCGIFSVWFVNLYMCISIYCGIIEMPLKKMTNTKLEKLQLPPASFPDEEIRWKHHCVSSGWTLSQEWDIWLECPRSHESEFGQTFRVVGGGALGKQKTKLFPWILYMSRWSVWLRHTKKKDAKIHIDHLVVLGYCRYEPYKMCYFMFHKGQYFTFENCLSNQFQRIASSGLAI